VSHVNIDNWSSMLFVLWPSMAFLLSQCDCLLPLSQTNVEVRTLQRLLWHLCLLHCCSLWLCVLANPQGEVHSSHLNRKHMRSKAENIKSGLCIICFFCVSAARRTTVVLVLHFYVECKGQERSRGRARRRRKSLRTCSDASKRSLSDVCKSLSLSYISENWRDICKF
jgi:hypothetical protein